ncbi:hypothetical protein ICE98_02572 [Lactococcus lactis]|nr:hypothetical protein [Lactococcus lactis]
MSAYESVVVRYAVNTIDLDLENEGLTDVAAGKVRAQAIAELQKKRKKGIQAISCLADLASQYRWVNI